MWACSWQTGVNRWYPVAVLSGHSLCYHVRRGDLGDRSWATARFALRGRKRPMFIAMNRFKVLPDAGAAFEEVWTSRDTHLRGVPGFMSFHLLRGPERDDHVLYSS